MMLRMFRNPTHVRFRFGLRQLFLLMAVACVGAFLGSVIWQWARLNEEQARLDEEVSYARRNLRSIVFAMQEYQSANRALPYSDKGADAALFALRHLIGPAAFESPTRSYRKLPARWDMGSRQLVNGDIAYLNEPNARPDRDRSRVILACDLDVARQLYATGNGAVRGRREPIPTSELLGSWVTVEGFLVADKSTFDKWCETHPIGECTEWRSIEGQPDPIATRFKDGSSAHYIYVAGRLTSCEITTANGRVIDEVVETDRYGRIVGISRSPDK